MAGTFTAVDLSRLPAPAIVELLDYETIFAAMVADLQARLPTFDATIESDPAVKVLQVAAYRELLLRAEVNDAARAVMVAFATGTDLDHLAAIFGVTRFVITAANPVNGVAEVLESDSDFRRRVTLAPEGYSVAGPEGAYIFHALSAHPDVLDASATSPTPGAVLVTVLSRNGNGIAGAGILSAVNAYLSAGTRRPMTDDVTVQSAEIVQFEVVASITTFAGPDAEIVRSASRARLDELLDRGRRLGRDVTRATILAAIAGVEGVQNATLTSPAADIVIDRTQCARCTSVTLTNAGVNE